MPLIGENDDFLVALIKAAIAEGNMYLDSVRTDHGPHFRTTIVIGVTGDIHGTLILDEKLSKKVIALTKRSDLIAERDRRITDMGRQIERLKKRLSHIHQASWPHGDVELPGDKKGKDDDQQG